MGLNSNQLQIRVSFNLHFFWELPLTLKRRKKKDFLNNIQRPKQTKTLDWNLSNWQPNK